MTTNIFLIHFLKSKDLVVDIGANHGHYSLIASGKRISPSKLEKHMTDYYCSSSM